MLPPAPYSRSTVIILNISPPHSLPMRRVCLGVVPRNTRNWQVPLTPTRTECLGFDPASLRAVDVQATRYPFRASNTVGADSMRKFLLAGVVFVLSLPMLAQLSSNGPVIADYGKNISAPGNPAETKIARE